MGNPPIAFLYINGYCLIHAPIISAQISTIFRESDRQVVDLPLVDEDSRRQEFDSKGYHYTNTVLNIKQRLDIMGFTTMRIKADFQAGVDALMKEYFEVIDGDVGDVNAIHIEPTAVISESIEYDQARKYIVLKQTSFED
ncbi:MAG: HEPN/Toprim-associated domain-containing protein, partial [Thaumarchaeota archaeon]|nr:HEPN/Toprim-associated domain-containing protein [Nitrososphaerota archaeon]